MMHHCIYGMEGVESEDQCFCIFPYPFSPNPRPCIPNPVSDVISPAHDKNVFSYLIGTLSAPCEDVRAGVSIESLWQTPHQTLLNEVTLLDIHSGESAVEHASLLIGE